ncbi:hypothetical protein [Nocardia sp. NPDC056100]|uniref:hypothetical protein n=1 Tax=Nocardia sp. NPDC056100 TaxID=3345712 RepID=UPI0035D54F4F
MIGNMLYAHLAEIHERLRGFPVEKNISTARFNEILDLHRADGWHRVYEYTGPDAWIDYGRIHLKNGRTVLRFRWNNYDEGSVTGPRGNIEDIARLVR